MDTRTGLIKACAQRLADAARLLTVRGSVLVALLVGCGSERLVEARVMTRVCGTSGATPIFETLAGGEAGLWGQFGDRLIVGRGAEGSSPDNGGWTFFSVGLCGDTPAPLEAQWLMSPNQYGLFACGDDWRVGNVDAMGGGPTVWFAEGLSCGVAVSEEAVVAVDVVTAELVWAGVSGARRVLASDVGGVVVAGRVELDPLRVRAAHQFVAVVADDGTLHVVDGQAGAVVASYREAGEFQLASDGRFVVIDPVLDEVTLQPLPAGDPILLADVARLLGARGPDEVLVERAGARELFRVSTGEYTAVPHQGGSGVFFAGDRWVVIERSDGVSAWDPATGEVVSVIENRPGVRVFGNDGVWAAADDSSLDLLAPLQWVWATYDGSERAELAEPMARTKFLPVPDGGAVFLDAAAGDGPGTLLWQRGGEEALVIDHGVAFDGSSAPSLLEDDMPSAVYRVAEGDRAGLWRVALP